MTYEQLMVELFQFSSPTYYKWKKHENRPIFDLLDKYFSKEDLEEYVKTGKVSKYEAIENNIFTNHVRKTEILKFLSIVDTNTLKSTLIEALQENSINSGTIEYLSQKRSKFEVIKKIRNLLEDLYSEKQPSSRYVRSTPNIDANDSETKSWFEFEKALNKFNDKIGFDFGIEDRAILDNIISRYKVYNTLYRLENL